MTDYRLMVAPNGARRSKADHSALPLTPQDLAYCARRCQAAGADALHLHVRDSAGRHSLDAGRYREAMAEIAKSAPGMEIQITTESAGIYDPIAQLACLEALRPVSASVSVREIACDPVVAPRLYALAAEAGTRIQHILYSSDCIAHLKRWYKLGIVPAGMRDAIFVLGKYQPEVMALPQHLEGFLAATQGMELNWSCCAFGRLEHSCLLGALDAGGDLRIGFENSTQAPDGGLWQDNAASVAAFVKSAAVKGHHLQSRVAA